MGPLQPDGIVGAPATTTTIEPHATTTTASRTSSSSSSSSSTPESLWVRIASGTVGSVLTALAVTPLEVVKVRQQLGTPEVDVLRRLPATHHHTTNKKKTTSTTTKIQSNHPKENTTTTTTASPKRGLFRSVPCVRASASSPCALFVPPGVVRFHGACDCSPAQQRAWAFPDHRPVAPTTTTTTTPGHHHHRGTLAVLRSVWRAEGPAGIYAGLTPTLVMGVPNTVLYFATYEELKGSVFNDGPLGPALAGASARLVASTATAPLELIRTRQAAAATTSSSLVGDLVRVIRREGALSLYRGLVPTLSRDVPFSAVYWCAIEELRAFWREERQQEQPPSSTAAQAAEALFNGTVAGMLAAAVTTPLDVAKTRRQLAPADAPTTSTLALLRKIAAEEGIEGLWRGNTTRMIKVAPACAIMLSSYEIGKKLLVST